MRRFFLILLVAFLVGLGIGNSEAQSLRNYRQQEQFKAQPVKPDITNQLHGLKLIDGRLRVAPQITYEQLTSDIEVWHKEWVRAWTQQAKKQNQTVTIMDDDVLREWVVEWTVHTYLEMGVMILPPGVKPR